MFVIKGRLGNLRALEQSTVSAKRDLRYATFVFTLDYILLFCYPSFTIDRWVTWPFISTIIQLRRLLHGHRLGHALCSRLSLHDGSSSQIRVSSFATVIQN